MVYLHKKEEYYFGLTSEMTSDIICSSKFIDNVFYREV